MAKLKTLTFEEQLAAMSEKHGIPTEDAVNVFSAYRKTLDELVGAEADAGTKAFEVVTPFGCYSALWVESEKRTNSADGVEYDAPAHYNFDYAYPAWLISTANKNVDFSGVPNSSEIARSKAA